LNIYVSPKTMTIILLILREREQNPLVKSFLKFKRTEAEVQIVVYTQ